MPGGVPFRFTAYDGSTAGPADSPIHLHLKNERGPVLPAHRARRPGHGPRLRLGRPRRSRASTPATPTTRWCCCSASRGFKMPVARRGVPDRARARLASSLSRRRRRRRRRCRRWRRLLEGFRHSKGRDAEAIHHHYDVSNRFYEMVLGPSMTYTCACFPHRGRHARGGAVRQVRPGLPQARARSPACGCSTSGCGWGGMVRHAAKHLRIETGQLQWYVAMAVLGIVGCLVWVWRNV